MPYYHFSGIEHVKFGVNVFYIKGHVKFDKKKEKSERAKMERKNPRGDVTRNKQIGLRSKSSSNFGALYFHTIL